MNLIPKACGDLLFRSNLIFLAVLIMAVPATPQSQHQARSSGVEVEKRVEALLSKMTLEEKITLIGGINDFYIRALPRLGLPALRMSDGPMGVHDYGETTAYPAGIALAASWDTDLARRVGISMGKDARARGVHFILGPGMNIYRAPMNGRNFEYFGEDPYLASRMAVPLYRRNSIARCDCHGQALRSEQYGIWPHGSQLRCGRANSARNLSSRV